MIHCIWFRVSNQFLSPAIPEQSSNLPIFEKSSPTSYLGRWNRGQCSVSRLVSPEIDVNQLHLHLGCTFQLSAAATSTAGRH